MVPVCSMPLSYGFRFAVFEFVNIAIFIRNTRHKGSNRSVQRQSKIHVAVCNDKMQCRHKPPLNRMHRTIARHHNESIEPVM
jgi:hypothetical protein